MLSKEKAVLLKESIRKLYVDEGRSISYIYRLLQIDRHTLSSFIKENNFVQVNQEKKKINRFLKQNKEEIICKIKNGYTVKQICKEFHIGSVFYKKILEIDDDLREAKANTAKEEFEEYVKIDGEIWKPIVGYACYEVSNYGRIKRDFKIITPTLNKMHNRYYIGLYSEGKRKNLILARVVAHTFCDGYSEKNNTVNHKDGNTYNNYATNLEWVSQSDNNKHSYSVLKRKINIGKPINYTILYDGKYKFKTVAAFARFLGLSETQTRRRLDEPSKFNIKKIFK